MIYLSINNNNHHFSQRIEAFDVATVKWERTDKVSSTGPDSTLPFFHAGGEEGGSMFDGWYTGGKGIHHMPPDGCLMKYLKIQ